MDSSLTSVLTLVLIGVGAVFLALATLIAVISVTRFVVELPSRGKAAPSPEVAGAGVDGRREEPEREEPRSENLEEVALAAYALHVLRRSTVRASPAPSRWALAGRMSQLAPLRR